jgi:hypothetical protein
MTESIVIKNPANIIIDKDDLLLDFVRNATKTASPLKVFCSDESFQDPESGN